MILLFALAMTAAQVQENCDNAMTQTDMNICAAQDARQADASLNKQWSITAAALKATDRQGKEKPTEFEKALEAQRAWLKYRDAHCTGIAFYARGGSMESMLYGRCYAGLTNERIKQLKELIRTN
jgi:uncharacterized protein YecT (DUF1311 family)